MNWQTIEGKWDQVKGTAKQKWAKLTDDDLLAAKGGKDKFVGALKERYGMAKEEAERQIDGWLADLSPSVHKSETVSGTGKNPA